MDVRGAFIRASQQAGYSPQQPPELILTYVSFLYFPFILLSANKF